MVTFMWGNTVGQGIFTEKNFSVITFNDGRKLNKLNIFFDE